MRRAALDACLTPAFNFSLRRAVRAMAFVLAGAVELFRVPSVEASALSGASVAPTTQAPPVASEVRARRRMVRDGSSRRGVLLRSNVGLTAARIGSVPQGHSEYDELRETRFATVNHLSIGYGWKPNFALTLDGFRVVVPHRPHLGQTAKFEMRVDAESVGLGVGTTTYFRPLSIHVGQSVGYALGRLGGGVLEVPHYRGFGMLAFLGFEVMRSERIGIVLASQLLVVRMWKDSDQLTSRCVGAALGASYW